MNNSIKMSDDMSLIKASDKGDQKAFSLLYEKYHRIGEKHVRLFFANRNYEKYVADEYMGELDFVFLNAFRKFNRNLQGFHAYFTAILENSLYRYIGRVLRSNDGLRHYISLDTLADKTPLYELIEDVTIEPCYKGIEEEDTRHRLSSFECGMSHKRKNLTKAIILLKLQGYTLEEISNLLEIGESTVCRLFNEFRKKVNSKQEI